MINTLRFLLICFFLVSLTACASRAKVPSVTDNAPPELSVPAEEEVIVLDDTVVEPERSTLGKVMSGVASGAGAVGGGVSNGVGMVITGAKKGGSAIGRGSSRLGKAIVGERKAETEPQAEPETQAPPVVFSRTPSYKIIVNRTELALGLEAGQFDVSDIERGDDGLDYRVSTLADNIYQCSVDNVDGLLSMATCTLECDALIIEGGLCPYAE